MRIVSKELSQRAARSLVVGTSNSDAQRAARFQSVYKGDALRFLEDVCFLFILKACVTTTFLDWNEEDEMDQTYLHFADVCKMLHRLTDDQITEFQVFAARLCFEKEKVEPTQDDLIAKINTCGTQMKQEWIQYLNQST